MSKESLGALTDGIYAIAMTILVLELPLPSTDMELAQSLQSIVGSMVDYVLSFFLLFGFWYNQRRINELIEVHSRLTLWLNAVTLMLICLLPFSANLLYRISSQDLTLSKYKYTVFVDLLFVGICLSSDFLIHVVLWIISRHHANNPKTFEKVKSIIRSRKIATVIVTLFMIVTLIIPGFNRNTLIVIPLLLILEDELVNSVDWIRSKKLW